MLMQLLTVSTLLSLVPTAHRADWDLCALQQHQTDMRSSPELWCACCSIFCPKDSSPEPTVVTNLKCHERISEKGTKPLWIVVKCPPTQNPLLRQLNLHALRSRDTALRSKPLKIKLIHQTSQSTSRSGNLLYNFIESIPSGKGPVLISLYFKMFFHVCMIDICVCFSKK